MPSLSGKNIKAIAAGWYHTVALDTGGSVWVTGRNNYGQLGLNDTANRIGFTKVTSLNGKTVTAIAITVKGNCMSMA
ncbi:hypothetical protein FACS1894124_8090 [Spirochaetia bacterium]|nr:hypothetical protein FACS1894124_8090 [Spirochaetia bacterium]